MFTNGSGEITRLLNGGPDGRDRLADLVRKETQEWGQFLRGTSIKVE